MECCYVSLNLSSSPIYPFHLLNKASTSAFPSQRVKRTSVGITLFSSTNVYTTPLVSSSRSRIQAPCRNSPVVASFLFEKSRCSRTLSGYWVGPDSEDGWGYVQAYVDVIS